jgi:hypothetical protein
MRSTGSIMRCTSIGACDPVLAQRRAHERTDGQVRHVVIVHHIEVHQVRAGGEHGFDLLPRRAKSADRIEGAIQSGCT